MIIGYRIMKRKDIRKSLKSNENSS